MAWSLLRGRKEIIQRTKYDQQIRRTGQEIGPISNTAAAPKAFGVWPWAGRHGARLLTRRQALKRFGVGLAGMALAFIGAPRVGAGTNVLSLPGRLPTTSSGAGTRFAGVHHTGHPQRRPGRFPPLLISDFRPSSVPFSRLSGREIACKQAYYDDKNHCSRK
jgi:hypothetical protein